MGRVEINKRMQELFDRYKFVLLIIAVGIFLMVFPSSQEPQVSQPTNPVQTIESTVATQLEEILAQISGVGRVKVMLSESAGAETVFQTDEDQSLSSDSESNHSKTVIITNSEREEEGLIKTVTPPTYLGAIVVCQGGDSPIIRLQIVQAVANVTGISSDRITVLKMK